MITSKPGIVKLLDIKKRTEVRFFFFHRLNIFLNRNTTIAPTITITNGDHIGQVIHHQDQVILLVSFRIKNTRNNVPKNPKFTVLVSFSILIIYCTTF